MAARRRTRSTTRGTRQVTRTPNPTEDQLRKAVWRRRRLQRGLCADCGVRKKLKGITRCAGCALKKRRLNRRLRECRPWRKGSTGAHPSYSDTQLVRMARSQKVVAELERKPRKKAGARKKSAKKKAARKTAKRR